MNFNLGYLFSFKGRVNRQPYLLVNVSLAAIMTIMDIMTKNNNALALAFLPIILVSMVLAMAMAVKRSHDLGKTGWFALLMLVPILNIWPGLTFAFAKGTAGPNEYGEDLLELRPQGF